MNSNKLKSLAVLNDMTINELAKSVGVSKATFFRKLNGESEFSQGEIAKIAEIFNLDATDIYDIFFAT